MRMDAGFGLGLEQVLEGAEARLRVPRRHRKRLTLERRPEAADELTLGRALSGRRALT